MNYNSTLLNTFAAMLMEITFSEFLNKSEPLPLIDVRSPGEYQKGHIPGAHNIPLFSNEERAHVGTVYKKESKERAMELGYSYVAPKLDWFISESNKVAPSGNVAVHCWRGGMRSRSFAQHLKENGFRNVYVITGGYKAFRNYALEAFKTDAEICVLGGYTGSGKTHILNVLKEMGEQVIDLETLARHKGSAFGGIGMGAQPTIEQFENDLFWIWKELDYSKTIWLEDESHRIGNVNIPMSFFVNMRSSPVIFIDIPKEERIKQLVKEYAQADNKKLADSIVRISKRLGGLNTKNALDHLDKGSYSEVAMITLNYYDKFYLKRIQEREDDSVYMLEIAKLDFTKNAGQILEYYGSIREKQYKTNTI